MDPYALLSLLLLALFIATLFGMATKRLTHRYYLYFALLFLGSSLLAFSRSTFAGGSASSANLLATLLFICATLGMLTVKTKKPGDVRTDAAPSKRKPHPPQDVKKRTRKKR